MKGDIKRQEIAPGLILEKFKMTEGKKQYYVFKMEIHVFNTVDFEIDFTGSKNISLEGTDELFCKTRIEPFTKRTIAKIELNKHWALKVNFKYVLELPDIELQKNKLKLLKNKIVEEKEKTNLLSTLNINDINIEELIKYFEEQKSFYTDHDFPPTELSMSPDENFTQSRFKCVSHWRRAKFLFLDSAQCKEDNVVIPIVNKGIGPKCIEKGDIDNLWLLSVLAILSEKPKVLERVFKLKQANGFGFYKLKLCDMLNWYTINLDDYFPCYPLGDPFFVSNNPGELWPMLIEKAFAKKYGGYSQLEGGNCKQAFVDLTGCPVFEYSFNNPDVKKLIDQNIIWSMIKKWKSEKSFVLAVLEKPLNIKNGDKTVTEHGYGINRVFRMERIVEVKDYLNCCDFNEKLKQDSTNWTEFLTESIGPKFEDNMIYLTFDEFLSSFKKLTVCKATRLSEIRFKGKFVKITENENKDIQLFSSKWFYRLNVKEKANIIIGIHQQDEKCLGVKQTNPNVDLGLAIFNIKSGSYQLINYFPSKQQREVYEEVELNKGNYFIIPLSSGVMLNEDAPIQLLKENVGTESLVNAISNDLFEKLDIDCNGQLKYEELRIFYEYLQQSLDQASFEELLKKYSPDIFPSLKGQLIDKKLFSMIFSSHFQQLDAEGKESFLDRLGFTKRWKGIRNRVFSITFQSKSEVEIHAEDALKHGIDLIIKKLLLRNHGKDYNTDKKAELTKGEMTCVYLANE